MKIHSLKHSAVAPVLGNIMLIAIVVVGSSITVVFAQDAYNILQLSGYPEIENLTITGYDAREKFQIEAHNGPVGNPAFLATYIPDGVKGKKEVITVYIKNDGLKTVWLDEVKLAGTVYSFSNPLFVIPFGSYAIISSNLPNTVVLSSTPVIKPGQEVTLIFSLDNNIKLGRTLQFKLVTSNGFVVLNDVITAHQRY